jgi:hypothetical protein
VAPEPAPFPAAALVFMLIGFWDISNFFRKLPLLFTIKGGLLFYVRVLDWLPRALDLGVGLPVKVSEIVAYIEDTCLLEFIRGSLFSLSLFEGEIAVDTEYWQL